MNDRYSRERQQERYRLATEEHDVNAMIEIAEEFQHRRYFEAAKEWYEKAIIKGSTKAKSLLGDMLLHQGNFDEARLYITQAADNDDVLALTNLGYISWKDGSTDIAEKYLKSAIQKKSGLAAHYLAQLKEEKGDSHSSEYWYGIAADLGQFQSLMHRVNSFIDTNLTNEAISNLEAFLEQYDEPLAWFNLAVLYQQNKKTKEAIAAYIHAHNRGHQYAAYQLGMLHQNQGELSKAHKWLELAISHHQSAKAHVALGHLEMKNEDPQRALFNWNRAWDLGEPDALPPLATWHYESGDVSQAILWLQKGVELDHAPSTFQLASYYTELEDFEQAKKYYEILALRENVEAMVNLGVVHFYLEEDEDGVKWLSKAAEQGHPEAIANLKKIAENL